MEEPIIAVTGTVGKTSVVICYQKFWNKMDTKSQPEEILEQEC